jgi:hypothetical protein
MWDRLASIDFGMVKGIALVGIMLVGLVGTIIAALVAIGVPIVVCLYGVNVEIGYAAAMTLSLIALAGGLTLAFTSAFFGIVIPSTARAGRGDVEEFEKSNVAWRRKPNSPPIADPAIL